MELHDYGQNDDRYCFQQYWGLSLILVTLLSHAYCAGFGTLENSFQGGRHLVCVDHFPKPSPLICLLDIHLWLNVIGWWFQSVYKLNFKTDQADVGWFALAPIGGGSLNSSVWCFSESWISVTLWCRKTLQHSLISSWLTSLGLKYFQTTEQALYLLSAADIYFLLVALPSLCMLVFLHQKSVCYIWSYFCQSTESKFSNH